MSGTTEVRAALVTHLTAASPGAAIPMASVSWENNLFIPTIDTRFYRATFMPAGSTQAAVGINSKNRLVGIFQVSIFEPKGIGDESATTEAERIVACFKRGSIITYSGVSIMCERSYRKIGIQEKDWYHIPVIIEYRADVTN